MLGGTAPAQELTLELLDSLPVVAVDSPTFPKAEAARLYRALGIAVGKPLDRKRVDEGIRASYRDASAAEGAEAPADGGMHVQTLFVEVTREGRGVRVTLQGLRVRRLRKLSFKDVDASVLEEARRRVRIEEGETVDPRLLGQLKERIQAGYEARGYPSANVEIAVNDVNETSDADVVITVERKDPTRVGAVTLSGAPPELVEALRERLTIRRGDVYSKAAVEESSETIQRFLKANQYPAARVQDTPLTFSADKRSVDVNFVLVLGERIQFLFEGNTIFDEFVLRGLFTEEVLSQSDAAEKIASLIEAKYRAVGYNFCRVKPVASPDPNRKLKLVRFVVSEGPRVLLDSVAFNGGEDVGASTLRELFYANAPVVVARGVYWDEGVTEATKALQRQLQSRGYLSAAVSSPRAVFSPDKKGVELLVDVDLGPQTRLTAIDLKGNRRWSEAEVYAAMAVRPGDPVDKAKFEEARRALLAKYQSEGYVDVKYADDDAGNWLTVSKDGRQAVVRVHLTEGTRYRTGQITIEGNKKTKSEIIHREMKLKTGELYDPAKARQSEEDIALLGLFSKVEVLPSTSPTSQDTKDLKIILRENRPGVGELGFGALYEEPRLRLRGFLGLAYRNLWGLNQTASVRTQIQLPLSRTGTVVPFIEHATVLGYRAPNPFDLPIIFNAQLGFDRFEVSTVGPILLTRARIEGRIEKKLTSKLTGIYRLYRFEHSKQEDLSGATPTTLASIGSTGPGIILDFRDDIFNPRKGSYHTFDVELASPLLLSQDNISFVMAISRNSFYIPLFGPLSITLFAGGGYATSLFSGQPLPLSRLSLDLSLGGQASIRGFSVRRFSPATASPLPQQAAFYNGRFELTSQLFSSLSAAVFFDTGQIFPDLKPAGRNDGIGIGFRYKTPVGPVVIDVAQGLGEKREAVKFYFTVGTL